MRFLDKVLERENKFLKEAIELQQSGCPIYIYGRIEGGAWQAGLCLTNAGIEYKGFVVNSGFLTENSKETSIEELLTQTEEKVGIIVAFRGYREELLVPYKDKIYKIIVRDFYSGIKTTEDSGFFTYEWVVHNADNLQATFDMLQDELSKESLLAFINQKISTDFKYLTQVKQLNQYFDDDLICLNETERFLDCGAFDGDSARAFVNALRRRGISSYEEIISFEPDKRNYEALCNRVLKHHTCLCKGVSEVPGTVYFTNNGTSSRVQVDGGETIELESIDNYLGGTRATMIKMDIEGQELAALRGAANTIQKWHPKLAICIYHKREDLWEIPQYIKKLYSKYKFYIRAYEDFSCELVLYAL